MHIIYTTVTKCVYNCFLSYLSKKPALLAGKKIITTTFFTLPVDNSNIQHTQSAYCDYILKFLFWTFTIRKKITKPFHYGKSN